MMLSCIDKRAVLWYDGSVKERTRYVYHHCNGKPLY